MSFTTLVLASSCGYLLMMAIILITAALFWTVKYQSVKRHFSA